MVLTLAFASTTLYESTTRATRTSTTAITVVTIPTSYDEVATSYTGHLLALQAINPGDFLSFYEQNATVEWKGLSGGCDGNYTGLAELGPLLAGLMSDQQYLGVFNESLRIGTVGGYWVVNSTFSLAGNSTGSKSIASPYAGAFEATIAAQDSYARVDGKWMIASETWNFLHFDSSILERPFPTTCQG